MIQDLVKHATAVETLKESNKFSTEAKQLSVLAGAVVLVTWPVSEDMKPSETVQMGKEQAEFWRNKAGSESPERYATRFVVSLHINSDQTAIFNRVASTISEALRCFEDLSVEDISQESVMESRRTGSTGRPAHIPTCRINI